MSLIVYCIPLIALDLREGTTHTTHSATYVVLHFGCQLEQLPRSSWVCIIQPRTLCQALQPLSHILMA